MTAPAPILRSIAIVDTPGTNAVLREHEALTRDFVPRADLVLFVASADRPFTESERAFLEAIREWGKKVVLVLNKADLMRTPADLAEVVAFVGKRAGETLGVEPEVFALSAWAAQSARRLGDLAALEKSGLPAFEAKVRATLDERERLRLKLLNPLGVARRALREASERALAGLALLEGDLAALAAIEARLGGQENELAATSGCACRTSRRRCWSSSAAATPSSTSACASAASGSCSTASGCAGTSRPRSWPRCPTRWSAGWAASWTSWSRPSCGSGRT